MAHLALTPDLICPQAMTSLTVPGSAQPIPVELIVWIQADGNYSWIHFLGGQKCLVAQTLKVFDQQLPQFIRIHKAGLINPRYVLATTTSRLHCREIRLSSGIDLSVSRRRAKRVFGQLALQVGPISKGNAQL